VLDGRDIGTVVCPDATVKVFVTADLDVRARRRHAEQLAKGEQLTLERVIEVIRGRDERDSGRQDAPMKPAADAHILDTTVLSIDAAVAAVLAIVAAKRRG
jgi:CMP/dCMP kinase